MSLVHDKTLLSRVFSSVFLVFLFLAPNLADSADFCWKDSYGRGVGTIPPSRVADCPAGYTNNGANCGRGPDTLASGYGSILATCPPGTRNAVGGCIGGADTLSTGYGSIPADCPAGYTNLAAGCFRGADTLSAGYGSIVADCPPGYTNMGLTCFRPASTYDVASSTLADCPSGYTNMGTFCGSGAFGLGSTKGLSSATCPAGRFKGALGRCYVTCKPGYTNNGEFCGRGADSLSAASMSCPAGYFKSSITQRCHKTCPPGYTNNGETCGRGASSSGPDSMICPAGYFKGAVPGRCNKICPPGYTNTGETCLGEIKTASMDKMTCPAGYFKGLVPGRCNKTCPEGYTNTGETCFKPASVHLGFGDMICKPGEKKLGARCYPIDRCGAGKEIDAELCYDKCRVGYSGVGPVCWGKPPAGWVQCGMGAAKDSTTCGTVTGNQVLSTGMAVGAVATGGASCAAAAGGKAATAATKLQKLKAYLADLKAAYAAARPYVKPVGAIYTTTDISIDAVDGQMVTPADISRVTFQVAAIVDSCGFADTAAAYSYPKCSTMLGVPAP